MPKLCPKNLCTGCGACAAICKHNAIIFEKDNNGFIFPKVLTNKCVQCNRCEHICPITNSSITQNKPIKTIACHSLNEDERKKSSSGGLATLISKKIINDGGIVYGCKYENHTIKHIRCDCIEDIEHLQGSKYIQSDVTDVYEQIRIDLSNKKVIIFIGTPCQTAGIKSIFKDKIITIDLVCHGVPSIKYFFDSLPRNLCINNINKISFRVNSKYHLHLFDKNNQIIYQRPLTNDIYMKGFFNGITFRSSCYFCKYANNKRNSDLTLGDFWGLKSNIIKDKANGVSLVLINTNVGKELFQNIKNKILYEEKLFEEAALYNSQLNAPHKKSSREYIFKKVYPILGFKTSIWATLPDKMLVMKIKHLLNIIKE